MNKTAEKQRSTLRSVLKSHGLKLFRDGVISEQRFFKDFVVVIDIKGPVAIQINRARKFDYNLFGPVQHPEEPYSTNSHISISYIGTGSWEVAGQYMTPSPSYLTVKVEHPSPSYWTVKVDAEEAF
ncbi:hypothetical protein Dimus_014709 [Dionaea muscipula]